MSQKAVMDVSIFHCSLHIELLSQRPRFILSPCIIGLSKATRIILNTPIYSFRIHSLLLHNFAVCTYIHTRSVFFYGNLSSILGLIYRIYHWTYLFQLFRQFWGYTCFERRFSLQYRWRIDHQREFQCLYLSRILKILSKFEFDDHWNVNTQQVKGNEKDFIRISYKIYFMLKCIYMKTALTSVCETFTFKFHGFKLINLKLVDVFLDHLKLAKL
jgi:hypothetical protein